MFLGYKQRARQAEPKEMTAIFLDKTGLGRKCGLGDLNAFCYSNKLQCSLEALEENVYENFKDIKN